MNDEHEQDAEEVDDTRFPLTVRDKPRIEAIIGLVRDKLEEMTPDDLRSAATVLLALERLPSVTAGAAITSWFKKRMAAKVSGPISNSLTMSFV